MPHSGEEKKSVINFDALATSCRNGSYFMSTSLSPLCLLGVVVPLLRACLCTFSDDSCFVGRGGVFDLFLFDGR